MSSAPGSLPASAKALETSKRSRSGNKTQHEAEPFPGLLAHLREHFARYRVIHSLAFSLCHARQQRPTGRPCSLLTRSEPDSCAGARTPKSLPKVSVLWITGGSLRSSPAGGPRCGAGLAALGPCPGPELPTRDRAWAVFAGGTTGSARPASAESPQRGSSSRQGSSASFSTIVDPTKGVLPLSPAEQPRGPARFLSGALSKTGRPRKSPSCERSPG